MSWNILRRLKREDVPVQLEQVLSIDFVVGDNEFTVDLEDFDNGATQVTERVFNRKYQLSARREFLLELGNDEEVE